MKLLYSMHPVAQNDEGNGTFQRLDAGARPIRRSDAHRRFASAACNVAYRRRAW